MKVRSVIWARWVTAENVVITLRRDDDDSVDDDAFNGVASHKNGDFMPATGKRVMNGRSFIGQRALRYCHHGGA